MSEELLIKIGESERGANSYLEEMGLKDPELHSIMVLADRMGWSELRLWKTVAAVMVLRKQETLEAAIKRAQEDPRLPAFMLKPGSFKVDD